VHVGLCVICDAVYAVKMSMRLQLNTQHQ